MCWIINFKFLRKTNQKVSSIDVDNCLNAFIQLLCEEFLHEYFNENKKEELIDEFNPELLTSQLEKLDSKDLFESFVSAKIDFKNEHKKAALRLKNG